MAFLRVFIVTFPSTFFMWCGVECGSLNFERKNVTFCGVVMWNVVEKSDEPNRRTTFGFLTHIS